METYDLGVQRDPTEGGIATAAPIRISCAGEEVSIAPVAEFAEAAVRAGCFPRSGHTAPRKSFKGIPASFRILASVVRLTGR
ncbi:MAG: hypothetical protein QME96_12205 [Myxococcota bacterium]|nr:hypothetical protein [Myxococcota bacterium]